MTTITVPRETFDAMREALEKLQACKKVETRLHQLHEMGHGTDYAQHRKQFAAAWDGIDAALAAANAVNDVGINGLTEAETSASMSVMGLSKPTVQPQAKKKTLYECTGCGHIYMDKVAQCDCLENPKNTYKLWTATPKEK